MYFVQIYERKTKMDQDIVGLVETMDDLLSFVEDTDNLTLKLKKSHSTIQEIIQTVAECSASIRKYANSSMASTY